jgi:hypothetical protein
VADEARRERFLSAFTQAHKVQQEGEGKAILLVGNEDYPFPVPLVAEAGNWRWDVEAGLDEILTRRIGENELNAIEVMRAVLAAQMEYAEMERERGAGLQYARRLASRNGRKDGLYWPVADGEEASPLGPLVAQAQAEGYRRKNGGGDETGAYHGYRFRMLLAQGPNAEGGARDYIVNGRMIGGFALIATPAEYGNSGVMTFMVNQDGTIYEKDLGPETARTAARIGRFDPDQTWRKLEDK